MPTQAEQLSGSSDQTYEEGSNSNRHVQDNAIPQDGEVHAHSNPTQSQTLDISNHNQSSDEDYAPQSGIHFFDL